ncbi:MAG: cation-translocating P-type ATPase [Hadesarchaea archaeon]|nr:cation-translocating P-type ATPase [Hadesarchaea archaeon]MDH5685381.1 cation-translocating P-type ATPase [Hadesarchaea archaeon]
MFKNPRKTEGLSEEEAARRLGEEGYNELPYAEERSVPKIISEVIREPMFLLLISCGIIYLVLGDLEEAIILMSFVFVIIGIAIYHERKTERALDALRHLSSPRALVIRGGKQKRIPGREVVREDILLLSDGDRVPADCVMLDSMYLLVDESLLTGESVPVRKTTWDGVTEIGRPGGDDNPFVYSGTLVVQGHGLAKVVATGVKTEMGKIGKVLKSLEPEDTPLQKETGKLVRNLALIGLLLCVIVIATYAITRGDLLNGMLVGITLAMAILPEEFPVVLAVFLALGAWRISKKRVLTRRVAALETLGSATVFCVDKTGTLTMNKMNVSKIFAGKEFYDVGEKGPLPEKFHEVVEFGVLASMKDAFDPMEKAIKNLSEKYLANTEHIHSNWNLVQEYILSKKLLAMSQVWNSPDGNEYVIASKGAPEAIADLCHFDKDGMKEISKNIATMVSEGLRVIGVSKAYFKKADLPGKQHDFKFEFLGLLGFEDPARDGVAEAIKECYTAGIRVVMISGDYPGTAQHIAKKVGLEPNDKVITGPELEKMDDKELKERIKGVNIFARVVPEQKLKIVNALKANGEIVAMTGDGVNDAPALKSANIGIAMGERGTDVAREASSLVLLDDDFSSTVRAVKLGRRIYDNIRKAMVYILTIHIPIAGITIIPVLFNMPLVLLPVHIVFLELIIDPACSIVFEAQAEEADVMKRPPRDPKKKMFDTRTLGLCVLQGLIVFLTILLIFGISFYRGLGEFEARALTFTTLIIANLGLILANLSWSRNVIYSIRSKNSALWFVVGGTIIFLALVLYVPALRDIFKLAYLHPIDIAICLGAGILSVLWFEILKMLKPLKI